MHSFLFHPGNESVYILSARWNNIIKSMKILTEVPTSGKTCRLEYTGIENGNPILKQSLASTDIVEQESGILDSPTTNETYTFQFATNIPCTGTPTITYEGQVYNTIQIFSQCWLKENLNVGIMINGSQDQTDNSIKEKYCYNNEADSCAKYGGLYQWDEMMQYTHQQGNQGICPSGWHLPTDEELKVLEGAVDSHFGIGDPVWEAYVDRGYDAGSNLKTNNGWYGGGNGTDLFGFSGVPGGRRHYVGLFSYGGQAGYWWSSTERLVSTAWSRAIGDDSSQPERGSDLKYRGDSVRCLRDY
jgi:uncharacterized protein (TIGR02145 family)